MGLAGRVFLVFSASTAVGLVLAAGVANAQDADTQGSATLLQRLILGAGAPKVAVDTPQAVTVLEDEDIQEAVPDTPAALADRIPGVSAAGSGANVLGQAFNIRGFGPQEVGSNQEGRVQVNVDGATKYYESYRMGGFFDDSELYKRVEVLRGPASGTLYGTSVLGGVVNFTTKDASDFLEDGDTGALRLKMTGDSNQEGYIATGILAVRMGENAEFLAAGSYQDLQDIVIGGGSSLNGTSVNSPSTLLKGTFYLDEERERVLRASYDYKIIDGVSAISPGGDPICASFILPCDGTNNPLNPARTIPRKVQDTTAIISYEDEASDNPWLDLNVNLSYSRQQNTQEQFIDADFSYAYYELKADNTFEWITDMYENYLTVGIAGKFHERRREDFDGTSVSSHPEGNERYFGAFVQNEFIYQDRLTIIGGLRVDWRELEPVGTTLFQRDTVTPRPVLPQAVSDVAFAPKIAAIFDVTESFSVFGSYAYTERMAGIDEEYDWNRTNVQNNLDKETANSFEIGVSQTLNDLAFGGDALSYKLTGFYSIIDDLIVRGGTGQADYINQGQGAIYGAELEASYDSDYVFAGVAASLIRGDNRFTDQPLTSIAPDEVFLTIGGKIPEHDVRFGWDARFVAAQDRVPSGTNTTGLRYQAFDVHDMFASWKPQDGPLTGFEVVGRVDNIFDERYQEYLQTAGPAKGRTFKLSVARTFTF